MARNARDVLRLIVGQGLKLAGVGIVLGIAGALACTPAAAGALQRHPDRPAQLQRGGGLPVLVAMTASYIPARRAMAVDPIIAMRNE